MMDVNFIRDLGLVLVMAAVAGWVCRRFGLPAMLGYIAAGILVGPHVPWMAGVGDAYRIGALGQVGLVFLVFQIGQGFKLQRLRAMGGPLLLATAVIGLLMFNGSRVLAHALGWPIVSGFVLAGMLMVSSTALIGRTLRATGAAHSVFGQTVLKLTMLDDLVAVTVLTLLPVLGASTTSMPAALLGPSVRLAAVIAAILVTALLIVPRVLRWVDRTAPTEVRALLIGGLLLATALASAKAGFSTAIGAFLLGSVVASTGHKAQSDRSLGGLCEVFGALFFVAAGMLLDLQLLSQVWPLIVLVFGFAVTWRGLSSSVALLIIGQRTTDAVRAGISLTPIGEFSVIIALSAVQANLVPEWFYAMGIGLCVLSTAATPSILRNQGRVSEWLDERLPESFRKAVRLYYDWIGRLRHRQRSSLFWQLTGPRWAQIVVQILFVTGLLIFAKPGYDMAARWLLPDWRWQSALPVLYGAAFLLLLLPPSVALWRTTQSLSMICAEAVTRGHPHRARLRPAFEKLLHGAMCLAVLLLLSTFIPFESMPVWLGAMSLAVGVLAAVLFWRKLVRWHSRFEIDLRTHLGERSEPRTRAPADWHSQSERWRLEVREYKIGAMTRAAGNAIRDLRLRELFSCTVVGIERQGYSLPNPTADTVLYPEDTLLLLGSPTALEQTERWLGSPLADAPELRAEGHVMADLCLEQVSVPAASRYIGKSLGELKLMQRVGVQVVGLQREGVSRLGAGKHDVILPEDCLLVLGRPEQVTDLVFWLST